MTPEQCGAETMDKKFVCALEKGHAGGHWGRTQDNNRFITWHSTPGLHEQIWSAKVAMEAATGKDAGQMIPPNSQLVDVKVCAARNGQGHICWLEPGHEGYHEGSYHGRYAAWYSTPDSGVVAMDVDGEVAARMRTFSTGATRDRDDDKNDYEGFLSPLVLEAYGDYMNTHRTQPDGSRRAADNWQLGITLEAYRASLIRHVFIAWALWRGWPVKAERIGGVLRKPTLLEALNGILFNAMGMMHELLKEQKHDDPTKVA